MEFFVEAFDRMASRGRPLLTAVLDDREDDAKALLGNGGNPEETDVGGRSALHLAAAYGREEHFMSLLCRHLSPEAEDHLARWTPWKYALMRGHWITVGNLWMMNRRLDGLQLFLKDCPILCISTLLNTAYKRGISDYKLKTSWSKSGPKVGVSLAREIQSAESPVKILTRALNIRYLQVWRIVCREVLQCMRRGEFLPDAITRYSTMIDSLGGASTLFLVAADNNYKYLLKEMLEFDINVDARNGRGRTALHILASCGAMECVRLVLNHRADVNLQDFAGSTALHIAADAGNAECIRLLVNAGASVHLRNVLGQTALHCLAAGAGSANSVQYLLNAGAEIDAVDISGCTPLHSAADSGDDECVRQLLSLKANMTAQNREGRTPLHLAVMWGSEKCVELLLCKGADVMVRDQHGATPLHYASISGLDKRIKLLLKAGADVQVQDYDHQTPLHWAVLGNSILSVQYVRRLLRSGASVQMRDIHDDTPLHYAAEKGDSLIVKLLLENGAEENAYNCYGQTPLDKAIRKGQNWVIELLEAGTTGNPCKSRKYTNVKHVKLIKHMLGDVQANSCTDFIGPHSEFILPYIKYFEVVESTIMRLSTKMRQYIPLQLDGSPKTLKDAVIAGIRQLSTAVQLQDMFAGGDGGTGSPNLMEKIAVGEQTPKESCLTGLHLAIQGGSAELVMELLSEGAAVNEKGPDGSTPLHWAASSGNTGYIPLLVDAGANLNAKNLEGFTPLHYAAQMGNVECIRRLLDARADITIRDEAGRTPLHSAATSGSVECVNLLVASGADVRKRDHAGRKPFHYATVKGHVECAWRLLVANADVKLDLGTGSDVLFRICGETELSYITD